MEFQSGEWIDIYRELLPHDDWQELVRIQVTQDNYPFEVKLLERPVKQNRNTYDLSDWTVLSHIIMTETSQLKTFLNQLEIEQIGMSAESKTILSIRKHGQEIVCVTNDSVSMYGVVYEELSESGTEYENFFDAVLPYATFPVEVVFCGRGVLNDEDSIHAMTLTDTNWQAVFEDRLLHLLNRKEITSGFLPTNYSKPSRRTLENFMTEFMLCMPYNFIVTRDANGRFGMLDHFCTKTVCQIKCNTSCVKTSYAVFQLRHFRGLPLIQASA
ncbi:hypothetical protein Exig_1298 [Exiguobacterium sibiricum 255-15]|uniref:Uncharacterized protein n=1 Tax=Exiguobacterium sibiricum (strain DSM 17290 / CCUG 55495 / CIP 109462 / JCM 13490 / 255-15) TaxID=262543 RepID=B1YF95_EXIS2|nr:hypothetical protein [Exiguobacterium sibiricum]ACB60771.1 hypothetical protein Exig_1298 [Exiguobacterium sibiricum 255-15]